VLLVVMVGVVVLWCGVSDVTDGGGGSGGMVVVVLVLVGGACGDGAFGGGVDDSCGQAVGGGCMVLVQWSCSGGYGGQVEW